MEAVGVEPVDPSRIFFNINHIICSMATCGIRPIITPANENTNECHSDEGWNPGCNWMMDQQAGSQLLFFKIFHTIYCDLKIICIHYVVYNIEIFQLCPSLQVRHDRFSIFNRRVNKITKFYSFYKTLNDKSAKTYLGLY